MASNEDVHERLESVLSKFKVEDLKNHAMKDFPEGSWSGVCRIVKDSRKDLKPKAIAGAIVEIVKRNKLDSEEVHNRIDVLKLRASGLSTTKTWFAYEMRDKSPEHVDVPFSRLVNHVEHHTGASAIGIRAAHDYDSALLGVKRGRQFIAVCITNAHMFVCPRTNNIRLLESIAKAMGYKTLKYCNLSGRHVPSLVRILHQKKGATHLEAVISTPKYRALPRRTRLGLDFTTALPMRSHLDRLRGNEENAPSLQRLTLHAKVPYNKDLIYTTAVLASSNVERSLRDMAAANIIPPTSDFFSMIDDCSNEKRIKIT